MLDGNFHNLLMTQAVTYSVDRVFTLHNFLASNPPENRQTAPKPGSSTKDILGVTGRSILTLAKRLPEIADPNPVKIALGLVKLIIEIQQVRRGSSHCSPLDYRPRLWQTIWIPLNEGYIRCELSWRRWRRNWVVGHRRLLKNANV